MEQLESALHQSPDDTDEDRFISLLLLSKLMDRDNVQQVTYAHSNIDYKFLKRLLAPSSTSEMKEIALSVIQSFCSFDYIACDPESGFAGLLPRLISVLPTYSTEVLDCLTLLVVNHKARELFQSSGKNLEKMIEFWFATPKNEAILSIILSLLQPNDLNVSEKKDLFVMEGSVVILCAKLGEADLDASLKFDIVTVLIAILTSYSASKSMSTSAPPKWAVSIQLTLQEIFCNKLCMPSILTYSNTPT
jgi:hypothetical protein